MFSGKNKFIIAFLLMTGIGLALHNPNPSHAANAISTGTFLDNYTINGTFNFTNNVWGRTIDARTINISQVLDVTRATVIGFNNALLLSYSNLTGSIALIERGNFTSAFNTQLILANETKNLSEVINFTSIRIAGINITDVLTAINNSASHRNTTNHIFDALLNAANLTNIAFLNSALTLNASNITSGTFTGSYNFQSGNIGIGTTAPFARLMVNGTTPALQVNDSAYLAVSGGLVGIGNTAPNATLHVMGTGTAGGLRVTNQSNAYEALFVNSTLGRVGIGTRSPGESLSLNGTMRQIPPAPAFVGGFDIANSVQGVYVAGRYAYIGKTNDAGTCSSSVKDGCEFQIYDVSDPAAPVYAGGADVGGGDDAIKVYVYGRYAYLARGDDAGTCDTDTNTGCEFQIYDVSNASSPLYVGGADILQAGDAAADDPLAIFVSGRYAYIGKINTGGAACDSSTRQGCELQIYDISNPESPTYVSGVSTGTDGTAAVLGMFVIGRFAYIGVNGPSGTCNSTVSDGCEFQIYDVSDPASPAYIGGNETANGIQGLFASGRYVYFVKDTNTGTCDTDNAIGCEFQIFNVSDPENPTYVNGADFGGTANGGNDVFVSGRYAYIAKLGNSGTCDTATATGCELLMYDVSTPETSLSYIGGVEVGGNVNGRRLFVSGRYAYFAKNVQGSACSSADNTGCEFQIYDVSGIEATSAIVHSLEAGSLQVRENTVLNNQLYVAGGIVVGRGIMSSGSLSVTGESTASNLSTIDARNSAGTSLFYVRNDGRIGIGTSAPFAGLMINKTTPALQVNDSTYLAVSGGRVGIGTAVPQAKLQVEGGTILNASSSTTIALNVTGAASQTANLTEWRNNTGGTLASMSAGGNLTIGTTTRRNGITLYDTADGSVHCVTITSDVLAVSTGVCRND